MKLGSLFSGSGTAELAAQMCGIEPVWASEIEPFAIAVTKKNFPDMKHVGSILDIKGDELEPVDIICGGSPCQDLSVAGAQKGLKDGERSHLFFEMVRIIKEMRQATNGQKLRFVIWENVCGAYGSQKGEDFYEVIKQFCKIADSSVNVPRPEGRGSSNKLTWRYAGSILGNGWSLSWRTVDAQYWGVPQRRRRIYMILDLASENANETIFNDGGDWYTGEAPKEPMITKLADILELDADPKYNLSAKACNGILNRAEKRGKEMPVMLKDALEEFVYGSA